MLRKIAIVLFFLGFLISPAFAQVPPVGPAGCVAIDGVYDFDQNRYVPLGRVVGPCGTCWGRKSGEIFQIDCQTGKRIGGGGGTKGGGTGGAGQLLQNNLVWIIGFLIFIIILILIPSSKKRKIHQAEKADKELATPTSKKMKISQDKKADKKAIKEPKKPGKAWGIVSLILGILAILTLGLPLSGLILGILAVIFSQFQKKRTKASLAGLILGLLGIFITLIALLDLLSSIITLILILLILLLIAYLIKKRSKKETKAWGIVALISGILSILFLMSPSAGLPLGIAAIIFSKTQKNHKKTKLATFGLISGIIGIIFNLILLTAML